MNHPTANETVRFPRTILGTVCVPWLEDFTFDEERFRRETRYLVQSGLSHLYIFGTAGEGYAVSDAAFEEITTVFAAEMEECQAFPMVGVISLSLNTIIQRIEFAAALGVRHFQISLPSWGTLSDRELRLFFEEICGRFPELQFLHYNLLRSGRLIIPAEYAILEAEHENLVATKSSARDTMLIQSLQQKAPRLRHFFTEPGFGYGSLLGEPGFLISVASSNLKLAQQYFTAAVNGDTVTLLTLQQELMNMTAALISTVGGEAHMDGAYDKIFCKLHDEDFPLRLLPPYACAGDQDFKIYTEILRRDFPEWLSITSAI